MRRRGASVPLTLAATVVAALASLPLVYLLVRGVGGGADAWEILTRDQTIGLVLRTVVLVGSVAAGAAALGLALAWLTVRTDMPRRRTFGLLCALPLVIPSYVMALALIAALGPGGLSSELWGGQGSAWLFGYRGATLALVLATYPYVYLLVSAALRRQDPALEEAARSLGRSRWAAFREVTLPTLRPALAAGAVLSALYALSDFGVVSLMRHDVLTRAIFQQYRSLFDRDPAAVLGLVLVALTAVILVLESRSTARRPDQSLGRRSPGGAAVARPLALAGGGVLRGDGRGGAGDAGRSLALVGAARPRTAPGRRRGLGLGGTLAACRGPRGCGGCRRGAACRGACGRKPPASRADA